MRDGVDDFILAAAAYAEHGEYDSLFLSNYLDIYVKDAIKRVKGVGDAIVFGERKYAMRLWLDPARMAQRGLTATGIQNALAEQNVHIQFDTDAKIIAVIRSGSVIGKAPIVSMPHWGGIIPRRDLHALVAYLKTLK